MKHLLSTVLLSVLVAISVPSTTNSDYIDAPVEIIEIPSRVARKNDAYYLLAYETFKETPVMLKVGIAESTFEPTAKNPESTASGLYQIVDSTWNLYHCEGDRFNPLDNISCAEKIHEDSGLSPWNASRMYWE